MNVETAMNEEMLRIQKMVAEGKVTPEESVELLESVERPRQVPEATEEDAEEPRVSVKRPALSAQELEFRLSKAALSTGLWGVFWGVVIAMGPLYWMAITKSDESGFTPEWKGILCLSGIIGGSLVSIVSASFGFRRINTLKGQGSA